MIAINMFTLYIKVLFHIYSTITGGKNIARYLYRATRRRKLHQSVSKIDILRMDL